MLHPTKNNELECSTSAEQELEAQRRDFDVEELELFELREKKFRVTISWGYTAVLNGEDAQHWREAKRGLWQHGGFRGRGHVWWSTNEREFLETI